jgi:hypothetical protein
MDMRGFAAVVWHEVVTIPAVIEKPSVILTKIIATVGPACATPEAVQRMIEEGVRVFRINFSHGTFEDYAAHLARIRAAGERCGVPVAVLGDLSGPKIRVGKVGGDRPAGGPAGGVQPRGPQCGHGAPDVG